jgi:8-oxo-dGTP diphosphatase
MHTYDYPRPALTADVVALRFHANTLECLLIERARPPFEGSWALPGGFVDAGESPRAAAARELVEETAVALSAEELIEVGAFGDPGRDPRGWVVSVAWAALLPCDAAASAGDDARVARWWPLAALPPLAFDHATIISRAIERLRALTEGSTAPLALLPVPFRHRHARYLYSQIWGEELPPRALKAWLRRVEALERVAPSLYTRRPTARHPWER